MKGINSFPIKTKPNISFMLIHVYFLKMQKKKINMDVLHKFCIKE